MAELEIQMLLLASLNFDLRFFGFKNFSEKYSVQLLYTVRLSEVV